MNAHTCIEIISRDTEREIVVESDTDRETRYSANMCVIERDSKTDCVYFCVCVCVFLISVWPPQTHIHTHTIHLSEREKIDRIERQTNNDTDTESGRDVCMYTYVCIRERGRRYVCMNERGMICICIYM